MIWAYIDSSVVVAALFGETLGPYASLLDDPSAISLISSFLLQAEVLSALTREGQPATLARTVFRQIGFVKTTSLYAELTTIFGHGHVRGADAFHIATALWVQGKHTGLRFITLDQKQAEIAARVGLLPD